MGGWVGGWVGGCQSIIRDIEIQSSSNFASPMVIEHIILPNLTITDFKFGSGAYSGLLVDRVYHHPSSVIAVWSGSPAPGPRASLPVYHPSRSPRPGPNQASSIIEFHCKFAAFHGHESIIHQIPLTLFRRRRSG